MENIDFRVNDSKFRILDRNCSCGTQLNSWDIRCSRAVGRLKESYHLCVPCLAAEYDMRIDYFEAQLLEYFGMLPCRGYE